MLADIKPAQERMEELLNIGQTNRYDVPISKMTAQATHEVKEHRKKNTRKNNNDAVKGGSDPEKKTNGKVGLHVGSNTTTQDNDASTTKDNDADNGDDMNDAETEPSPTTTKPNVPNGQTGLALSFGDETLMAEQAWDLINHDHLDEHQMDDNNHASKPAYGMLAISEADTDVSSVESDRYSYMDVLSQDFFFFGGR